MSDNPCKTCKFVLQPMDSENCAKCFNGRGTSPGYSRGEPIPAPPRPDVLKWGHAPEPEVPPFIIITLHQ